MKTIYKYPFNITSEQVLMLPVSCELIFCGLDPQDQPCIWLGVDIDNALAHAVTIFVVGTGNSIPDTAKHHLGSFRHGVYMWHVYADEFI